MELKDWVQLQGYLQLCMRTKSVLLFHTSPLRLIALLAKKNVQHRRSSASISPVEDLLQRIHCFEENSQSPCYHSENLSTPRVANVTTADKPAHKHISHLSPKRANVSPKLSVTSLLDRYSFLRTCYIYIRYNCRLSFCSLSAILKFITYVIHV